MTRWGWMGLAIAWLWIVAAGPARADKVTLTNGDVLHGEVKEEAGRVRIQHPILGEVDLARADVMWITRVGEAEPEAPPAQGLADRCAASATAEAAEIGERPSPWDFAIGFGISNDSGNTEKFQFNADLEAAYRWGLNRVHWRITSFYEEANDIQTEGKYFSNLSYRRRISRRGSLAALWLVDRDDFADIELRNVGLLAYEHDFIQRERTTFSGALGAGGAIEKRKGQPQIETAVLFAQLEYRHEFSRGDSFAAKVYVIPYLDHTELSPMRLELLYAHPLREHFDLTAGLLVDYVPDPPGDIEPLDTKVTFGVRWKP